MRRVRIFVSSPGDVGHERRRVDRVVERLNGEFAGVAQLETIRWETEFYRADTTFQAQIPAAAECDIVVAVFRARLGTELPPDFERMPDGKPYPSGTAYEVLSAIAARQKGELPDVYVFRYPEPPTVRLDDPEAARVEEQWQRLKAFFDAWFVAAEGPFKAAFHTYASTDDLEEQLDRLLRGWLEGKVLHGRAVLWPIAIKGSPFRGLAAFGAKHAAVFFGRSRDIARAVDRWKESAEQGSAFLLLVGASGSGKSSLARAGVVPRLTVPGVVPAVDLWRVAAMRPSEIAGGPVATLAARLLDSEKDIPEAEAGRPPAVPELAASDYRTPAELAALLDHADAAALAPLLRALDRIGEDARRQQGYERPVRADLVLLVDQLDELFGGDVSPEQRQCFSRLLRLFAQSGRVWVVATLRADLYEAFLAEPDLLALKTRGAAYDLAPPGPAELAEIVRKPAEAADLHFEKDAESGEGLDERLLRDADRPDMLPLLQLALNRLFESRQVVEGQTRLTIAAYDALGRLAGIIDREAERALAGLGEAEQARLPRLLRRLVAVAPGSGGLTVRTAPLAEAAPDEASRRLVDALVAARILLTSGEGAAIGIHLAHQRVLQDWQRARALVADDQDFYRVRDEVEAQRLRWQAAGESRDLLIPSGLPLAEAETIAARFGDELTPETRGFIAASGRRARLRQRLVAGAAVVFALLAIVATGAGVVAWREQREALRQQALAEHNLGAAKQAVNGLVFNIGQGLRDVAGMRGDTIAKILGEAQATIDKLLANAPDDPQLHYMRAAMLDEFAQTYLAAGDLERAKAAAAAGLAEIRALAAAHPADADYRRGLATSLDRTGHVALRSGDSQAALAAFDEELALARAFAAAAPDDLQMQRDVSEALNNRALAQARTGDVKGAIESAREALTVIRGIAAKDPGNPRWQRDLSVSLNRFGDRQVLAGDPDAALAAFTEALSIRRKLLSADPGNSGAQHDLWLSLTKVADRQVASGKAAAAGSLYDEALRLIRALAAGDPGNAEWQSQLAATLLGLGDVKQAEGDASGAAGAYKEALDLRRRLAALDPQNLTWQRELASCLDKIGESDAASGDAAGALAAYEESLKISRGVAAREPNNIVWQDDIALTLVQLGGLKERSGDNGAALKAYEEAASIARRIAKIDPSHKLLRDLSVILNRLGDARLAAKDAAGAVAAYEEAVAAARSIAEPSDASSQSDLAAALVRLAKAHIEQGDLASSRDPLDAAAAIREALAGRFPNDLQRQDDAVATINTYGDVLLALKDARAAVSAYRRALTLAKARASRSPADPAAARDLWQTLRRIGDGEREAGHAAAALSAYDECVGVERPLIDDGRNDADLLTNAAATLGKIGDLKRQANDLSAAAAAYEEAVADFRRLLAKGDNPAQQREMAVVLNKLGDVRLLGGQIDAASAAYADALAAMRALVAKDASKPLWQEDLAYTLARLGLAKSRGGDNAGAAAAYAEALDLRRRLADADPVNAQRQRNAVGTANSLGEAEKLLGDKGASLAAYRQALALAKRIAERRPNEKEWQILEIVALVKIADVTPDPDRDAALNEALAIAVRLEQQGKLSDDQRKWPDEIRQMLGNKQPASVR